MKRVRTITLYLLAIVLLLPFGLSLGGCASDEDAVSVPWNRPHDWENNRMPQMGGL